MGHFQDSYCLRKNLAGLNILAQFFKYIFVFRDSICFSMTESKIYQLYLDLLKKCGSPRDYWPQWCKKEKTLRDREIIAIGAILTQRTSWRNAQMALENLKRADLLSFDKIAKLDSCELLVPLVRVAGFYNSKPKRLFTLCSFIVRNYGNIKGLLREKLKDVREKLLIISGIGLETADTILLYALDKPSFVIDEYTKRLVGKEHLVENFDYDYLKELFEKNLPMDVGVYQNFHALIILSQKEEKGWGMKVV